MRQARPVGGHAVEAFDCAHRHRELIGAGIAHHANALHRQQYRKALPHALVPAGLAHFIDHDRIGLLQQCDLVAGDVAENADREAWAWKRLPNQEFLLDAEVAADAAHFVLEQLAQRLHELELHAFRQAADVVMALDGGRRTAHRHRFDDIRVERALRQEVEFAERLRLVVEDVDERGANDLALLLGVSDAGEPREEDVGRIDMVHGQRQLLVARHHLLGLVQAQQAVVDEDALQAIANRAVDDRRRDGRVDAARQATNDTAVAHLGCDAGGRLINERRRGPVASAAADVERKVAKQFAAAIGMGDLGVEQHGVVAAVRRFHHGHGRVVAGGRDSKPGRRGGHEVAVTRPHLQFGRDPFEQARLGGRLAPNQRVAELAVRRAAQLAAQHVGHQLHAVADAECRDAQVEHGAVAVRRALVVDAARAARQDEADGRLGLDGVK